jgi:hypothetical protein
MKTPLLSPIDETLKAERSQLIPANTMLECLQRLRDREAITITLSVYCSPPSPHSYAHSEQAVATIAMEGLAGATSDPTARIP